MLLEGLRLERWRDDQLQARAVARRGSLDRGSQHLAAEALRIELLDPRPGRRLLATANGGAADLAGERFELFGDVQIADPTGRQLLTERAIYEGRSRRWRAPGAVVVRGKNFEAQAPSLEADLAADVLRAPGPIRGSIRDQTAPR